MKTFILKVAVTAENAYTAKKIKSDFYNLNKGDGAYYEIQEVNYVGKDGFFNSNLEEEN
jgi:hypothetical protein